jgi:hypothetical protein
VIVYFASFSSGKDPMPVIVSIVANAPDRVTHDDSGRASRNFPGLAHSIRFTVGHIDDKLNASPGWALTGMADHNGKNVITLVLRKND